MGKKGEATKQQIRSAAYTLFAENGYRDVSMQDICTKCGLSKGGLYRHYGDKCQLFMDILRSLQQEEADLEEKEMRQKASAAEILDRYLEHVRQDLQKDTPNLNIALYEFCIEHKESIGAQLLAGQYQRGLSILLSLLDYGRGTGEFHAKDPKGAAAAVLFLVEGLRMTNEVMPVAEKTLADVFGQIREIVRG